MNQRSKLETELYEMGDIRPWTISGVGSAIYYVIRVKDQFGTSQILGEKEENPEEISYFN